MFADAIAWEGADPKDLADFERLADFDQFAWRGALRRIAEQAEHIRWFGKDPGQALAEAKAFQKVIDYLSKASQTQR